MENGGIVAALKLYWGTKWWLDTKQVSEFLGHDVFGSLKENYDKSVAFKGYDVVAAKVSMGL